VHRLSRRGSPEKPGDAREAFLLRLLGESQVAAVGLRFSREGSFQIFVGFGHINLLFQHPHHGWQ
jgi:hypothetical protein